MKLAHVLNWVSDLHYSSIQAKNQSEIWQSEHWVLTLAISCCTLYSWRLEAQHRTKRKKNMIALAYINTWAKTNFRRTDWCIFHTKRCTCHKSQWMYISLRAVLLLGTPEKENQRQMFNQMYIYSNSVRPEWPMFDMFGSTLYGNRIEYTRSLGFQVDFPRSGKNKNISALLNALQNNFVCLWTVSVLCSSCL